MFYHTLIHLNESYRYVYTYSFSNTISLLVSKLSTVLNFIVGYILSRTSFLTLYYTRSELLWGDGFLFDFLQKKTLDSWLRQYVIYTGFLFSERLVFELVIRVYNDLIIWNFHYKSLFDASNPATVLLNILFLFTTLLVLITFSITLVL